MAMSIEQLAQLAVLDHNERRQKDVEIQVRGYVNDIFAFEAKISELQKAIEDTKQKLKELKPAVKKELVL